MDATNRYRSLNLLLAALIAAGAVVAVDRALDGSSDLRGFHGVWAENWEHPAVENRPDPEDPYPATSYVLFAPLGALPLWLVALLFYAVNVAAIWALVGLSCRMLDVPWSRRIMFLLPGLGVAPFLFSTIMLGQNTLLLMLLVSGAFYIARANREFLAGTLIGLAAAIKVYPAIFLLPFVLRGSLRTVAGFAIVIVMLAGPLGMLALGPNTNAAWHERWFAFVSRADQDRPEDPHIPRSLRCTTRYNNQATQAVLARLMLPINARWEETGFRVNVMAADSATWRRTRIAATALFLGISCIALVGVRRGGTDGPPGFRQLSADSCELALTTLLFFAISPMVWTHYFLWAFFPLCCVMKVRPVQVRASAVLLAVWLAAVVLISSTYSRAVGTNLWAALALFVWMAAPHVRQAMTRGHRLDLECSAEPKADHRNQAA